MATTHLEWLGTTYRILLTAAESGAALGMFESLCPPGYGPPRHVHAREDETFHVVSGEVEFWIDGKTTLCGPGTTLFAPRGHPHTFRVAGLTPARMLTVLTPGGFEGFFGEVAERRCRIPEDMGMLAAIGGRYGVTFTGPPLGASPASPQSIAS